MLSYTTAALHRIIRELRLFAHLARTAVPSVMVVYLCVLCFLHIGYLWFNIAVATLTSLNLLTYLFTYRRESKTAGNVRKSVHHASICLKLLLNALSLLTIIYTIFVSPTQLHPIRLVFVPLTLLLWVLQVSIECITLYAESRISLFMSGMRIDAEPITTILHNANNIIHTVLDEELETAPPIPEHHRSVLSSEVERHRARKTAARHQRRARRNRFFRRLLRPKLWRNRVRRDAPANADTSSPSKTETALTPAP